MLKKLFKKNLIDLISDFLFVTLILEFIIDDKYKINDIIDILELIACFIFIVLHAIDLFKTKDKKQYLKDNYVEIILTIPFLKIFKIFKFIKVVKVLKYYKYIELVKEIKDRFKHI